jgi:hypothetical protein
LYFSFNISNSQDRIAKVFLIARIDRAHSDRARSASREIL